MNIDEVVFNMRSLVHDSQGRMEVLQAQNLALKAKLDREHMDHRLYELQLLGRIGTAEEEVKRWSECSANQDHELDALSKRVDELEASHEIDARIASDEIRRLCEENARLREDLSDLGPYSARIIELTRERDEAKALADDFRVKELEAQRVKVLAMSERDEARAEAASWACSECGWHHAVDCSHKAEVERLEVRLREANENVPLLQSRLLAAEAKLAKAREENARLRSIILKHERSTTLPIQNP